MIFYSFFFPKPMDLRFFCDLCLMNLSIAFLFLLNLERGGGWGSDKETNCSITYSLKNGKNLEMVWQEGQDYPCHAQINWCGRHCDCPP